MFDCKLLDVKKHRTTQLSTFLVKMACSLCWEVFVRGRGSWVCVIWLGTARKRNSLWILSSRSPWNVQLVWSRHGIRKVVNFKGLLTRVWLCHLLGPLDLNRPFPLISTSLSISPLLVSAFKRHLCRSISLPLPKLSLPGAQSFFFPGLKRKACSAFSF